MASRKNNLTKVLARQRQSLADKELLRQQKRERAGAKRRGMLEIARAVYEQLHGKPAKT